MRSTSRDSIQPRLSNRNSAPREMIARPMTKRADTHALGAVDSRCSRAAEGSNATCGLVSLVFVLEEDQIDAGGDDEDRPCAPPAQTEPCRSNRFEIQPRDEQPQTARAPHVPTRRDQSHQSQHHQRNRANTARCPRERRSRGSLPAELRPSRAGKCPSTRCERRCGDRASSSFIRIGLGVA